MCEADCDVCASFDRESNVYDRIEDNKDVPDYLQRNAGRYRFMLDRDPADGNFVDYGKGEGRETE